MPLMTLLPGSSQYTKAHSIGLVQDSIFRQVSYVSPNHSSTLMTPIVRFILSLQLHPLHQDFRLSGRAV